MSQLNPVTFRGMSIDGKRRNLTIGRIWLASKESRQVVSDGQHRLEPREKLEKFCPIMVWNDDTPGEIICSALVNEDELITLLKNNILRLPTETKVQSIKGPNERRGTQINCFAFKRLEDDKVVCRVCNENDPLNMELAMADTLILETVKLVEGLALLFDRCSLMA